MCIGENIQTVRNQSQMKVIQQPNQNPTWLKTRQNNDKIVNYHKFISVQTLPGSGPSDSDSRYRGTHSESQEGRLDGKTYT